MRDPWRPNESVPTPLVTRAVGPLGISAYVPDRRLYERFSSHGWARFVPPVA
jgi:hypothetical protein